jgi:DNA-binding MarR family transcriptional regulator
VITDRPLFGSIDSSFITERKDIYSSGMVAEIGLVAHGVWGALKCHADIGTGETYVGMRAIGEECGISPATVMRAIRTLERAHLVRIVAPDLAKNVLKK